MQMLGNYMVWLKKSTSPSKVINRKLPYIILYSQFIQRKAKEKDGTRATIRYKGAPLNTQRTTMRQHAKHIAENRVVKLL